MTNTFIPNVGETYYTTTFNEAETRQYVIKETFFGTEGEYLLARCGYCFKTEGEAQKSINK